MDEAKKRIQKCLDNKQTELDLDGLRLTELPDLSDSLTRLYCENNQLTYIPIKLKSNKTYIECENKEELFKMGAIKHIQKVARSKRFLKKIRNSLVVNRLYEDLLYDKNISIIISQYL